MLGSALGNLARFWSKHSHFFLALQTGDRFSTHKIFSWSTLYRHSICRTSNVLLQPTDDMRIAWCDWKQCQKSLTFWYFFINKTWFKLGSREAHELSGMKPVVSNLFEPSPSNLFQKSAFCSCFFFFFQNFKIDELPLNLWPFFFWEITRFGLLNSKCDSGSQPVSKLGILNQTFVIPKFKARSSNSLIPFIWPMSCRLNAALTLLFSEMSFESNTSIVGPHNWFNDS